MVKLFSKNSNLCDHNSPTLQTDRQTDRQTTCDRNAALCTKVHRAVKTDKHIEFKSDAHTSHEKTTDKLQRVRNAAYLLTYLLNALMDFASELWK